MSVFTLFYPKVPCDVGRAGDMAPIFLMEDIRGPEMRAGLSPALIRRGLLVQGSFHIETELRRETEGEKVPGGASMPIGWDEDF